MYDEDDEIEVWSGWYFIIVGTQFTLFAVLLKLLEALGI